MIVLIFKQLLSILLLVIKDYLSLKISKINYKNVQLEELLLVLEHKMIKLNNKKKLTT